MKKYLRTYLSILAAAAVSLTACHKVTVTPDSLYTGDVFPKNDEQFQSVIGNIYTSLRGHYSGSYFFAQELASDESIMPVYGGNWLDGSKYIELHRHNWNKDNAWIQSNWSDVAGLIGLCNQTIYTFRTAPEGDAKVNAIAEIKTLRAWAYWEMMDMFGNVPLDTIYPSPGVQAKATRAQVFSFVESELKSNLPYLKTAVSTATYGKVTKWMAFSLLAKMYLNAPVYIGSSKNNECIAACDSVIKSGSFAVEGRGTYLNQFSPTNGPSFKEFIWAIPYDPGTSNGYNFPARYDLNRNLGIKYRYAGSAPGSFSYDQITLDGAGAVKGWYSAGSGYANNKPSGPRATLGSFWKNYFTQDAGDIRNDQWLYGYQYWPDGTKLTIITTKQGYDANYKGSDAGDSIRYHLFIDSAITLRLDPTILDVGNDEIAWNMGIRNIKFLPDANSASRNQSNDIPVFRYSDILLMKAEAILRGGTSSATAISLVNQVRNNRTTSAPWASVTLDDLYAERSREFTWECWHRNDMIRFGKFEDRYGFKTNTDTYRRIFPLPTNAMNTNSKLVQNDGY
ncbi:MAG TPA: RagB/SusD family nutrient uptake outer membrane protein [Niastella sp.]